MDIFITVITWIVGLYAGFMLLMAIGFSAGGAAQTGNSELGILSTISSLLFIYLVWMGVSSVFFSNEVEIADLNSSVKEVKVKKAKVAIVDYDTPSVDVSEISAPSTESKSRAVATEAKVAPSPKATVVKAKESTVTNNDLLLWLFYAIAFIVYFSWVFAPSKIKGSKRDLVKKKIIGTMTLKKDESGLQAWDPKWKPEKDKE